MGHILHDGCGEKKIAPKTPSGRLGWGYPDLGEACERCWGCIFFWIYVNWLVLVAWDLWNLQRHLTKPSQPMLLRIAPFFFGLTAAHSKKNNQVSILSVFQRFQHIFSWNIFSHHLVLHSFFSWKVNKDVWGAPLLEPFGLFKHEKKKSFMTSQKSYCSQRKTSIPVSALAGQ